MQRVPGRMGAGPASEVPLQLVPGDGWQGGSGNMFLSGVGCRGAGRCQGCKPDPRNWPRLWLGQGRVLGTEPPWAVSPRNHLGPFMSCSSAGGAKQPQIPPQTACCANSLLQAGPGSGTSQLCQTLHCEGWWGSSCPHPSAPPPSCPAGRCPLLEHAMGTRLPGTSADPGISSLLIQP